MKAAPVDIMDEARSLLRVIHAAIGNPESLADAIHLQESIGIVLTMTDPIRDLLNRTDRFLDDHGQDLEIGE